MAKRLSVIDVERCVGCQACMFACSRRMGEGGLASSCIGIKSAGGVRKGFVVTVCRACPDPPCTRVCPTRALMPRDGGGARLKPELCIACENCVNACPFGAIFWDSSDNKPLICLYCGYCERYCPYEVIRLEETGSAPHGGEDPLLKNSET